MKCHFLLFSSDGYGVAENTEGESRRATKTAVQHMFAAAAASAACVLPILQDRIQYCSEAERVQRQRSAERAQLLRHHQDRRKIQQELFTVESEQTIVQDLQRYRIRLALNRRQAVRDATTQRFMVNQTIITVVAIMVGCVYICIGQGVLPDPSTNPPVWLMYGHALSNGVGVSTLMIAMWCAYKVQARMSYYEMSTSSTTRRIGGGDGAMTEMSPLSTSSVVNQPQRAYNCGMQHTTFNEYFECHCESLRKWSVLLLYLGAWATMICGWFFVAMAIFQDDPVSQWLMLGIMVAALFSVGVMEYCCPDRTIGPSSNTTTATAGDADYGGLQQDLAMERRLDELLHEHQEKQLQLQQQEAAAL